MNRDGDRASTPFFIMGCPRSGTTLVSRILDAHSRLAVYHESQYYPTFAPLRPLYGDLARRENLVRLVEDVRACTRMQHVEPPGKDELLAALPAPTFEGVLAALLGLYAAAQGKARGADKTPGHHAFLDDIRRGFAASPVIFVLRDPRDVALSLRKAFRTPAVSAARMWNEAFAAWTRHQREVLRLRYEDLVRDPEGETRAMCRHLGEEYEPGTLEFHREVPDRIRSRAHLGKLQAPIDAASVGKYRELGESDLHAVESICRAGMETLGYALETRPDPRLEATARRLSKLDFLRERVFYYGLDAERWRRGLFRWRVEARFRARRLLGASP